MKLKKKKKSQTVACIMINILLHHRGSVHSAPVLGAAAVGGSTPAGISPLPGSERVASQRGSLSQGHPLLQQGQGTTHTHTNMLTQNTLPATLDIVKTSG